jgi:ABC-type uncharacterized transport system permease subunit
METGRALQLPFVGVLSLGLLGVLVGAGYLPAVLLPWAGSEALTVGSGFLAIAVVMFADLRRRDWGRTPRETDQS